MDGFWTREKMLQSPAISIHLHQLLFQAQLLLSVEVQTQEPQLRAGPQSLLKLLTYRGPESKSDGYSFRLITTFLDDWLYSNIRKLEHSFKEE